MGDPVVAATWREAKASLLRLMEEADSPGTLIGRFLALPPPTEVALDTPPPKFPDHETAVRPAAPRGWVWVCLTCDAGMRDGTYVKTEATAAKRAQHHVENKRTWARQIRAAYEDGSIV